MSFDIFRQHWPQTFEGAPAWVCAVSRSLCHCHASILGPYHSAAGNCRAPINDTLCLSTWFLTKGGSDGRNGGKRKLTSNYLYIKKKGSWCWYQALKPWIWKTPLKALLVGYHRAHLSRPAPEGKSWNEGAEVCLFLPKSRGGDSVAQQCREFLPVWVTSR